MSDLFPTQCRSLSLPEMLWDTCISEYLHKDSNLEVSSNRGGFKQFFRKLTHHSYLDGHLGQSWTRYRPQFYKVSLLPFPRPGTLLTTPSRLHIQRGVGGGLQKYKKKLAQASRWYGQLRVQKLTLSVLNSAHAPARCVSHTLKECVVYYTKRKFLCVVHLNFRKSLTEIPRNGCETMRAAAVTWQYPISPDGRLAKLVCTGSP